MTRHTIHFTGRVQGVGFRYTTRKVASRFVVAGIVENLDDGRVRVEAEGEEAELDRFTQAVLETMRDYVRSHTVITSPATGDFGQPSPGALSIRS